MLNGNKQIASNIPAGVGSWTGLVSGFAPGNNYIMILTLSDEPDRKIAQTEGFWIKSKGTIPEASVSAAGESIAGTLVATSGSPEQTASGEGSAAAAGGEGQANNASGSGSGSGAASSAEASAPAQSNSGAGRSSAGAGIVAAVAVVAAFAL